MLQNQGLKVSKTAGKILVVDDNEIFTLSVTNTLNRAGYDADAVSDGKTALLQASINKYDLILLDIILPDIDGFKVCKELKKNQETKYIPVIFISALEDGDDIYNKGFEYGVMDYLRKPFTTPELIFKIKNYLRLAKTETDLRQSEILFRRIVNDQNEFVVRYKPDGTLTFVNTSFCNYLDKNDNELLGSNFFEHLNIGLNCNIRSQALTSDMPCKTNIIEICRIDGVKAWHQWTQRVIVDNTSQDIVIQSVGRDITASKINDDFLKKYEYIFKHAGWGIVANDPESMYFDQVNEAYAKMHGYTVKELKGKKIGTIFENSSDENVMRILKRVNKRGHYLFRSIHKRKDGQNFPALSNLTIMKGENNRSSLLIANVQDITELEKVNNALIESEERFRNIFVNTPDIIVIVRLDDLAIIDLNDRFTEYTKLTKNDVVGKPVYLSQFFVNPTDLTIILDQLEHNNVVSNVNAILKSPDGHNYPVLVSCSKLLLEGIAHIVVIIRDIEDIKLFQESLQKSETKYRLLADYNYNWEFWLGPDGKYIYISPSCERLSGYKPHDFDEYPDLMTRLIHPESKEICYDHFKNEQQDSGPEVNIEFLITDRYGNEKWISHNCNAVFDENGKFAGRRGNNSDITQKKLSEMELHKLSTAIEQSSSAIIITDIQGDIEYVNPYFEKLTGYTYKEVLGKTPSILKSNKTDPRIYEELWDSITSGKKWQGEFINKKKNNELYIESAIITPVKDKNSRIVNFVAIKQDITKQKEIDRKILQTIISTEEKERSRFAQNLHDDLGPLLSTAKLYIKSLETAKDRKNKQTALHKSLEAIDESLMSIKEIAYDLSPHILRNFGLVSGINSLANKINETGSVVIEFESELEERLDENIESSAFRIISELINNTIKHANASKISINILKNGNELFLTYTDNGIGFNLEKALEKRFSNGLSNIINRIKSLGGEIVFSGKSGTEVDIIIQLEK